MPERLMLKGIFKGDPFKGHSMAVLVLVDKDGTPYEAHVAMKPNHEERVVRMFSRLILCDPFTKAAEEKVAIECSQTS